MQENNQVSDSNSNLSGTQPVPKEEEVSPNTQTVQQDPAGLETQSNVPAQPVQETQEQKQETVETISPEQSKPAKKKKGCINTTNCCIGSCVGCLLILIALVLIGIFAAPTLSKYLNNLINPGVEVPEVKDVDLTDLDDEIASLMDKAGSQSITVTEDEFNQLLKRKYNSGTEETAFSSDVRTNFRENEAELLMKFTEWMPWALIEVTNDSEGKLTTDSIKLGPVDISNFVKGAMENEFDEGEFSGNIDMSFLLASIIFGDDINDVSVSAVYFNDDEVKLEVIIASLDDIEQE